MAITHDPHAPQAEEERDDMERVKLDNKRILFNLLPAHVAQHFLMSNPRNMVSTLLHGYHILVSGPYRSLLGSSVVSGDPGMQVEIWLGPTLSIFFCFNWGPPWLKGAVI